MQTVPRTIQSSGVLLLPPGSQPALPPRRRRLVGWEWAKHLPILVLLALELLPLYLMLEISVKDNRAFLDDPWLPVSPAHWHLENYVYGLRLIAPMVANTVFVAVIGTLLAVSLSLLSAYFFARYRMPGAGVLWAGFLALMLMPSVANLVPLFSLLKRLDLLNSLWALIIVGVASTQVFNIYVLRNFIEQIPRDLFEAAEVDGASHFQQLVHIVLPMSRPIVGTLVILGFIGSWNEFLLPLVVLRDKKLFTLGVGLIYLDGEYVKQWGRVMAAYLVASLPLVILFLLSMKLFVQGLSSGAVKG